MNISFICITILIHSWVVLGIFKPVYLKYYFSILNYLCLIFYMFFKHFKFSFFSFFFTNFIRILLPYSFGLPIFRRLAFRKLYQPIEIYLPSLNIFRSFFHFPFILFFRSLHLTLFLFFLNYLLITYLLLFFVFQFRIIVWGKHRLLNSVRGRLITKANKEQESNTKFLSRLRASTRE